MKKMRKILSASILGVAVLSQGLGADMLDDVLCGTFGVWGQATYLKPTQGSRAYSGQTPAAIGQTTAVAGPAKSRVVCPKYEWGFEVGGMYLTRCDCFYAKVFGGWNEFTDISRIQGFLQPTLPLLNVQGAVPVIEYLGTGFGSLKTEYWYIEGRVGHFLMRGCGSDVHAYLGVRYVDLCERLIAAFSGTDISDTTPVAGQLRQRERSEMNATGPTVGFGGQFCVWGDFGISGELGASALIGTQKNRVRTFQFVAGPFSQSNEFQQDNCVAVIPAINLKAGVNWFMEYCNFKGGVELGYKLDHYFNAFKSTNGMTLSNVNYVRRDVGFGGPYISVGVSY